MSRDWRVALERIALCAERVVAYTAGLTYEQFLADTLRYDAALRNLEVMGEAAKRVPAEVREQLPALPWREMIGFRDRLAHGYDALDDVIVWRAVHDGAPRVLMAARELLDDAGDAGIGESTR